MAAITSVIEKVERNAWTALGAKIGIIEKVAEVGKLLDATDLNLELFQFSAPCLVLHVGMEVVTPTTETVDGQIGLTTGTEYLGASNMAADAKTQYGGGQGLANVMAATDSKIVLTASGDPGAAGVMRVWAIIADINDVEG